jgi:very-short-patch-repair endonuclease
VAEGRGGVVKLCPECCVIVELDGAVHEGHLEIERDETRTTYLKELGIRVMRFQNRAVFESLELVLNSIGYWNRLTTPPRPSATPPPAEEGSRLLKFQRAPAI